jgi:hypothetical protein
MVAPFEPSRRGHYAVPRAPLTRDVRRRGPAHIGHHARVKGEDHMAVVKFRQNAAQAAEWHERILFQPTAPPAVRKLMLRRGWRSILPASSRASIERSFSRSLS